MGNIITIPKNARVLVLEDSNERIEWFVKYLPVTTLYVNTADEAIAALVGGDITQRPFDFIFLDHDLGLLGYEGKPAGPEGDGHQVAKHMASQGYLGENVVIHSWNTRGAANMAACLRQAVVIPFGRFDIKLED